MDRCGWGAEYVCVRELKLKGQGDGSGGPCVHRKHHRTGDPRSLRINETQAQTGMILLQGEEIKKMD